MTFTSAELDVRVDVAWVADSDYHVFLQPLPILSTIRKGHHGIVDISSHTQELAMIILSS